MRAGRTRSNSATRSDERLASSISGGWKSVFCARTLKRFSTCESSMMSMPSRLQPCDSEIASSSSRVSERVTYSARSPRRTPSMRNCIASVVLPTPGVPSMRYIRSVANPPFSTSSSPAIPVVMRLTTRWSMDAPPLWSINHYRARVPPGYVGSVRHAARGERVAPTDVPDPLIRRVPARHLRRAPHHFRAERFGLHDFDVGGMLEDIHHELLFGREGNLHHVAAVLFEAHALLRMPLFHRHVARTFRREAQRGPLHLLAREDPVAAREHLVELGVGHFLYFALDHLDIAHRIEGERAQVVAQVVPGVQVPVLAIVHQALRRDLARGGLVLGAVPVHELQALAAEDGGGDELEILRLV